MGPCCLGNIGSVLGGHVPAISVSTLLGVVVLSSMEPTGLVQDSISMFFLYFMFLKFLERRISYAFKPHQERFVDISDNKYSLT